MPGTKRVSEVSMYPKNTYWKCTENLTCARGLGLHRPHVQGRYHSEALQIVAIHSNSTILLLLVIINNMLGNSLARVNEPSLMESCPGKPGDEKGTGCEGKIQERVCVVYHKLSFDLSCMAGLDFPFNWIQEFFDQSIHSLNGSVYVGCFQEVNVALSLPSRGLQGNKITHKNPITSRLQRDTDEGHWEFQDKSRRFHGEVAFGWTEGHRRERKRERTWCRERGSGCGARWPASKPWLTICT